MLVAVTCFVWVLVLWRWDRTHRVMAVDDIVVYLGALPLATFGLLLGFRWALRRSVAEKTDQAARERERPPPARSGGRPAAAADAASQVLPDAPGEAAVTLLAAHLHCAGAQSPAELVAAARQGRPRPAPDPLLCDDDGLPMLTARALAGDDPAVARVVAEIEAMTPDDAAPRVAPHLARALALLHEPLAQALAALAPWAPRLGGAGLHAEVRPSTDFGFARDATRSAPARGAEATLHVLAGWPEDWDDATVAQARAWLDRRIAAAVALSGIRVSVSSRSSSGPSLWQAAELRLQPSPGERGGDAVLVVAAHSDLDPSGVDRLEHAGRLYRAGDRPRGVMPGEGAAALVLLPGGWPSADPDSRSPLAALQRIPARASIAPRGRSIDAPGRSDDRALAAAAGEQLEGTGTAAATLAALACDADQHTARATEFFELAVARFGHLAPPDEVVLTGTVTAGIGAASTLAVIACAAELARERQAPVLALALADPLWRLALLVQPAAGANAADDSAVRTAAS